MKVMTTFAAHQHQHQHPRTDTGRFTAKDRREAEAELELTVLAGNVVLIEPSSTVSMTRSMAAAGVIDLREPDVALDPAAGATG
jgi:hypothetical protein